MTPTTLTPATPTSDAPVTAGAGGGRRRGRRAPAILVVPAVAAAVVALAPIVYLVDRAGALGWSSAWREVWQQRTADLLVRSVGLAVTVTAACVVIGVAAAWLVVRTDVPGGRVWAVVLTLPLAVPSYVAAFAWVSWRPSLAGFGGAALVLTLTSYPYVLLPVMAALRRMDPAQEEVARALGRRPVGIAVGLTLRQLRPAIAAGGLLVALYVLSDFGAVGTMRYEVFTWVIYGAYRAGFNPARAAVLSLVLAVLALVVVAGEARARGAATQARLGAGATRDQRPLALGGLRWPALVFLTTVAGAALAFPGWRLVHWVRRSLAVDVPVDEIGAALGSSLRLSALAAVFTTALATPVGVLAARYRSRSTAVLERSTYVAHALPGIVIAISLVFVGVRVLQSWYQEVPLLVLAYVVLFLPLAVGSARTSVEQSPVRQEEVARSLGAGPWRVLTRVTLPRAWPGLAAGACLVFVTTMKELPATLLLHPTGTDTLATRLWTFTAEADYASGAPYAAVLVLCAGLPAALLARPRAQNLSDPVEVTG
jgi:iron(III) transport system permease protein